MAMKPFVRIIKRGQKLADLEKTESAVQNTAPADSPARVTKTTVSTWVKEFQQRSRIDAKLAFKNLFKDPLPQPSEV